MAAAKNPHQQKIPPCGQRFDLIQSDKTNFKPRVSLRCISLGFERRFDANFSAHSFEQGLDVDTIIAPFQCFSHYSDFTLLGIPQHIC